MEEMKSYVKISYKKSSSAQGGVGYDIDVCACEGATEKQMEELGNTSINTAKKLRQVI